MSTPQQDQQVVDEQTSTPTHPEQIQEPSQTPPQPTTAEPDATLVTTPGTPSSQPQLPHQQGNTANKTGRHYQSSNKIYQSQQALLPSNPSAQYQQPHHNASASHANIHANISNSHKSAPHHHSQQHPPQHYQQTQTPLTFAQIFEHVYTTYIQIRFLQIPTTPQYSEQWRHVFETLKLAYWEEIDKNHSLSSTLQTQQYTKFVFNFFKHFESYWPHLFLQTQYTPSPHHSALVDKDGTSVKRTYYVLNYLISQYKKQLKHQPLYGALILNHSLSRVLLVGHKNPKLNNPQQPQPPPQPPIPSNRKDINTPTVIVNDSADLVFTPPRGKGTPLSPLSYAPDPVEIAIREVRDTTGLDISHFISPYDYINVPYANGRVVRLYIVILPLIGLEQIQVPSISVPVPPQHGHEHIVRNAGIVIDYDNDGMNAINTPDWVEIMKLQWFELKALKSNVTHPLTLITLEYFSYWLFCKLKQFEPLLIQHVQMLENQQKLDNNVEKPSENGENGESTPTLTSNQINATILNAVKNTDPKFGQKITQYVVDLTDKLFVVCDLIDINSAKYKCGSEISPEDLDDEESIAAGPEAPTQTGQAAALQIKQVKQMQTFQKQQANGQLPHRFNTFNHIVKRYGFNRFKDLVDFHHNKIVLRPIYQSPASSPPTIITPETKPGETNPVAAAALKAIQFPPQPATPTTHSLHLQPPPTYGGPNNSLIVPCVVFSTSQPNDSLVTQTSLNTVIVPPVVPHPSQPQTHAHHIVARAPCDLSRCGRIIKRWLYNLTVQQDQYQNLVQAQKQSQIIYEQQRAAISAAIVAGEQPPQALKKKEHPVNYWAKLAVESVNAIALIPCSLFFRQQTLQRQHQMHQHQLYQHYQYFQQQQQQQGGQSQQTPPPQQYPQHFGQENMGYNTHPSAGGKSHHYSSNPIYYPPQHYNSPQQQQQPHHQQPRTHNGIFYPPGSQQQHRSHPQHPFDPSIPSYANNPHTYYPSQFHAAVGSGGSNMINNNNSTSNNGNTSNGKSLQNKPKVLPKPQNNRHLKTNNNAPLKLDNDTSPLPNEKSNGDASAVLEGIDVEQVTSPKQQQQLQQEPQPIEAPVSQ